MRTTFLHENLDEEIFMEQLVGFKQPTQNLVYRWKKPLYRLKQSSRWWYKRFDSYVIQKFSALCEYDCYIYVRILNDDSYIFLLPYVDDMLIVVKSICEVILVSSPFSFKISSIWVVLSCYCRFIYNFWVFFSSQFSLINYYYFSI